MVETHSFGDDGSFPNSRLRVLIYHRVEEAHEAAPCEALFAEHGWLGAWRDGIYRFHHFHSTTHEALGIISGSARVLLGGAGGRGFEISAGDVLVLPAGTGHCNRAQATICWSSARIRTGWNGTSVAGGPPSTRRCSKTSARSPFPPPIRCTDATARCVSSGVGAPCRRRRTVASDLHARARREWVEELCRADARGPRGRTRRRRRAAIS
jgi:hypothetical protein